MISDTEQPTLAPSRRRKITKQDLIDIARLVATRKLTEIEACLSLGIGANQWHCWKSRNKRSEQFATLITQTRANMIDGLVSKIESAGDDYDIQLPNGKIITKRGDWRAPAWLLEKTAPQFAPQQGAAPTNVTIQISTIHEQLKRVIGFANDTSRIGYEPSLIESGVTTADNSADGSNGKPSGIKMPIRRTAISTVTDI